MSGEALTAGLSATLQLVLQVVEVHDEGIDAFPRQRHQEVGSIRARNLVSQWLSWPERNSDYPTAALAISSILSLRA